MATLNLERRKLVRFQPLVAISSTLVVGDTTIMSRTDPRLPPLMKIAIYSLRHFSNIIQANPSATSTQKRKASSAQDYDDRLIHHAFQH